MFNKELKNTVQALERVAEAQFHVIHNLREQLEAIREHFGIVFKFEAPKAGKIVAVRPLRDNAPLVRSFMVGCKSDCEHKTQAPTLDIKKKKK